VARGGAAYVRLQWHVGPRGRQRLPVEVDLRHPFAGSDQPAWEAEYDRCVEPARPSAGLWPDAWPVVADDASASRFSLLERDPSAP